MSKDISHVESKIARYITQKMRAKQDIDGAYLAGNDVEIRAASIRMVDAINRMGYWKSILSWLNGAAE